MTRQGVVPPLGGPCVAVYTAECDRITRMSQLRDGDAVVCAVHGDFRPYTPRTGGHSAEAQQRKLALALCQPRPRDLRRRRALTL